MCMAYSSTSPDSKSSNKHVMMGPPSSNLKVSPLTILESFLAGTLSLKANSSLSSWA